MSFADWLVQASIYFPSSIIVGALALFGVRWTLSGQADLQRAEWDRREAAFQNDLKTRERIQHEIEEKRYTAALRTVAIEAINNAVTLLAFSDRAKKSQVSALSLALTREQFDNQLPLIAERLEPAHLQQTAVVYMQAFRYKVTVDPLGGPVQPSERQSKEASELGFSFSVIFRTLAYKVFTKEQMEPFENILRIAQMPPS